MSQPLRVFTEHLPGRGGANFAGHAPTLEIVLPFEQRQKARQRARLADGTEIGIHLARGTVLRGGDRLRADDGTAIAVVAAHEAVSTVRTSDLRELARVAYHLGNRHVPLEVGAGWVRYLEDHVLDGMVRQLGLAVLHEQAPFEPEAGAYGGHSHGHSHDHGTAERPLAHDRGHGHSHGHDHHGHAHDHEHPLVFGGWRRHGHDQ